MKQWKKDAVVLSIALGFLLLSFLLSIIMYIYRGGKKTKCYLEDDWNKTKREWKYNLRKFRGGDDSNVRYE